MNVQLATLWGKLIVVLSQVRGAKQVGDGTIMLREQSYSKAIRNF